jgi:uncharacterized membrane protein YadS
MGRVLLLAPIVFILIYIANKDSKSESKTQKTKVGFPSFIGWFLFFTVLASFEVLPKSLESFISEVSHYVSIVAMSAIGLMIHFKTIKESASKAFKVSTMLFIMQLIFSGTLISIL